MKGLFNFAGGTALVFVFFSLSGWLWAQSDDMVKQKQELQKIKKELESSRQALDSLQGAEKKVLKDITNLEQQASANQKVIQRLNNQLGDIRKNLGHSQSELEQSQRKLESARLRFMGNINYYYIGGRHDRLQMDDEPEQEKAIFRKTIYLRSLAAYDRADLTRSTDYLARAESQVDSLAAREKKVGATQKKKKSEYVLLTSSKEVRQKDLSKLRRTKEREADRLLTLTETARQMEDLIARLEKERLERKESESPSKFDYATGNFVGYKGGLTAPFRGKIVTRFGWKTDPVNNLKSFSPGIEIQGPKGATVVAVAPGVAAYVGVLRGYGNFVIVEHEDGYYTMYSGLESLAVGQNQLIDRGEKLGLASTGLVKFELRLGREPIDPLEWLQIDSFN